MWTAEGGDFYVYAVGTYSQLVLLTTNQPVKDVAYTMGFNDYSYFIRLFKKIVCMTPGEYRQSMR